MKKLVLLVAVLSLCVSAFGQQGDANDPNLAVLVFAVKASVNTASFTDVNSTKAQLITGSVNGFIVARVDKNTLETYTDSDPNNDQVFIAIDKKAKKFTVISGQTQDVEFALADIGHPIFDGLNNKGADTGKSYINASIYVNATDANSENDVFTLDVYNGVAQLKSTAISTSKTKILIPTSIKFGNAEFYDDSDLIFGYKAVASASLDSKYTKSANSSSHQLRVKGTADLITGDLVNKKFSEVSAADFIQK